MFLHFELRHIHSKFCQLHLILSISRHPRVFCKKTCSEKFRKIHKKTPVPELLFLIKLQASASTPPLTASAYYYLLFQQYELEVSFNFVQQSFYGNSSLTHYHIVIYRVRCKNFLENGAWKWMDHLCLVAINAGSTLGSQPRVPP